MPKLSFSLKHPDLFHKIIKIVRKHDGNYTAMQDDFETTKLIMEEIDKWMEGVSILTPLCASVILKGVKSRSVCKNWEWVREEKSILDFSNFIRDFNAGEETSYDPKRFRR